MSNSDDDTKKGILLESGTNEVELLRFGLGAQNYGINVAKIRQVMVFDAAKTVPIPGTPDSILGSFCFRGTPIPAIDLRNYLRVKMEDESPRRLMLVCEFNQCTVGFVVDSVDTIMRCSWQQFVPMAHKSYGSSEASVVGTIVRGEAMTPILDVEAILATLVPSASIEANTQKIKFQGASYRENAKLVYCEDSNIVRKVLLRCLAEAGFRHIETFNTGAEGLAYLQQSRPGDVDLIISDIEMPQMDGLTMCKRVHDSDTLREIPFVFFSSTVSEEMKRKCEAVGGNRALAKPEIHLIVDTIDELLGKGATPA